MNAPHDTPAADGFFMPPEWAAHSGCWMGFPCREAAFGGRIDAARWAQAAVANAIAEFESVVMLARPEDENEAKRLLSGTVEVIPLPIDDSWLRDSGATILGNASGERAGVDWRFNAWGNKYTPYDKDNAVAEFMLRHLNIRRYTAPLVMEGGSFHSNGNGTVLTTRQCLCHANRNPQLSQAEIEQYLCDYLGAKKILWIDGDDRDSETDGHIDNIACFAAPDCVLLMTDDNNPQFCRNRRQLQTAVTADGNRLTVIAMPQPHIRENGTDLLASYINFYFADNAVIMPSFGVAEDRQARDILRDTFPDRKIVQIPATDIVRGGGGIHCITQQIPTKNLTD